MLRLVSAVFHAAGYRNPWDIVPFTTGDNRLGFVNVNKGIAVSTDFILDPETVNALAAPQREKAPYIETPPGWVQLHCDIEAMEEGSNPLKVKAEVVAYGLMTCNNSRHAPTVAFDSHKIVDPREWDFTEEQRRRVLALVEDWLINACRQVASHIPDMKHSLEGDLRTWLSETRPYRFPLADYRMPRDTSENLIRIRGLAAGKAAWSVIEPSGFRTILRLQEDTQIRWFEHFKGLLAWAIFHRLEPIVEAYGWAIKRDDREQFAANMETFYTMVHQNAEMTGLFICGNLHQLANDLIHKKMVGILFEGGPVYLSTSRDGGLPSSSGRRFGSPPGRLFFCP